MNKVKIIVDSTVDLNQNQYKELNLAVIPLNVNFGEENFKDGLTISPDEVYKKVTEKGALPTTAAPSPNDFIDEFGKWIDQGYDIFYTGLSSTFSSSMQNAMIAAQSFEEGRIYVLDSKNLSTGTGLLVLKAVKYANEGKSAKEIFDLLSSLIGKVSTQFVIDELDYLHKGGRCSGASKLFGHLFHIHPIIKVVDGSMIVYKKPRGPQKIATNELINELKTDMPNVDMDNIIVTHSGIDQSILDYVVSEVAKVVDKSKILITRAGCVISTHCGPSGIGVLYLKK